MGVWKVVGVGPMKDEMLAPVYDGRIERCVCMRVRRC